MKATTCDRFCDGRLAIRQHRNGYRFSIDAVLLAGFLRPADGWRLVDLGTGCGIVALLVAMRFPAVRVVGVELQAALAALAAENAQANRLSDRVRIVHHDLRRLSRQTVGGGADLVVANPPYRPRGSGRVNPDGERAVARHELRATLADVLDAARRLLDRGGRFVAVYPAVRSVDLIHGLRTAALEPKRMRIVHSRADGEARLVLVEAVRGGRPGVTVEPPLPIYDAAGDYTPEVAAIMAGGGN